MPTFVRDTFDPEKGAQVVDVPWTEMDEATLRDYAAAGDTDAVSELMRRRGWEPR